MKKQIVNKYSTFGGILFCAVCLLPSLLFSCKNYNNQDRINEMVHNDSVIGQSYNGAKCKDQDIISSIGDTVSFLSIMEENTFFIRYSNYSCPECVDFVIKNMEKKHKSKIVFLISDIPVTDLHVFEVAMPNAKFYKAQTFWTDFDSGVTPYVFMVSNGRLCNYYIPRKETPELYKQYLNEI